jgi:putative pyrroloquinoline-quinone binding quinoprotein
MAAQTNLVFGGIKGKVVALDRSTGTEVWRTDLKGSDFVNLVLDNGDLFATTKGRLYRLDPDTGNVLWCNELPGLGWGIVTLAGASQVAASAEKRRRDAQAAAAAAS